MTHHLEAILAIGLAGAAVVGAKISIAATHIISEIASAPLPEWATWIVGPVGTLVALGIALRWMSARLATAENKADARDKERAAKIETLYEKHADRLEMLTHGAMKVTDRVANSLDALVEELKNRPCGINLPKSKLPHDEN
jgi:hypothetical protein